MDAYVLDWLNLLLRFVHVITAIAWIGSSFYFVFLDDSLEPPHDEALEAKGVTGQMWAVHGGGFYNPQKYAVGPKRLPAQKLHWFYWESYSTWLSGFALFALMYLWQASAFLVDARVFAWPSDGAAIGAALGLLAAGWIVYDAICRLVRDERMVGALVLVFVAGATWLACALFAGRAAFLIVGAMLGTVMSANVLVWIIPGQRKVVAALREGQAPDPVHGQRGKQRSVHNTYFTLPVLAAMLSNHYPMLYGHARAWLVLLALMLSGALVRRFFVLRHKGTVRWDLFGGGAVLAVLTAWLIAPAPRAAAPVAGDAGFATVRAIVAQRCVACHNAQLAQKGVRLDTPAELARHAQAVYQQAVLSRAMPQNNATDMTDAERAVLARWFEAGARVD